MLPGRKGVGDHRRAASGQLHGDCAGRKRYDRRWPRGSVRFGLILLSKISLALTNQSYEGHMKTPSKPTSYSVHSIAAVVLLLTAQISLAGSATWLSSPQDAAWENPNNWTPGGPPNGPSDVATFAQSSQTTVNISTSVGGEQHRVLLELRLFRLQYLRVQHIVACAERTDY